MDHQEDGNDPRSKGGEIRIDKQRRVQVLVHQLQRICEEAAQEEANHRHRLKTAAAVHSAEISELQRRQTQAMLEVTAEATAQAASGKTTQVRTVAEDLRRSSDRQLNEASSKLSEALAEAEELRLELLEERMNTQTLESDCEAKLRNLRAEAEREKVRARSDAADHASRLLARIQVNPDDVRNQSPDKSRPKSSCLALPREQPQVLATEADRALNLADEAKRVAEDSMNQRARALMEEHRAQATRACTDAQAQLRELQKRRREVERSILEQQAELEKEVAKEVDRLVSPHQVEVEKLQQLLHAKSERQAAILREMIRVAEADRASFERECEMEAERVIQNHRQTGGSATMTNSMLSPVG